MAEKYVHVAVLDPYDLEWIDGMLNCQHSAAHEHEMDRAASVALAGQTDGIDFTYLQALGRCKLSDQEVRAAVTDGHHPWLDHLQSIRERDDAIVKLKASGCHTNQQIATLLGLSVSVVAAAPSRVKDRERLKQIGWDYLEHIQHKTESR